MNKEQLQGLCKNELVNLCIIKSNAMASSQETIEVLKSTIEDLKHTIELTDDLIADMEVD